MGRMQLNAALVALKISTSTVAKAQRNLDKAWAAQRRQFMKAREAGATAEQAHGVVSSVLVSDPDAFLHEVAEIIRAQRDVD